MEKDSKDTTEKVAEAQNEAQNYLQNVLKEIDEQEEERLQYNGSGRGGSSDYEEDALSHDEDGANGDEAVRAIQQELDQMNNPITAAAAPPVTMSSFLTSVSSASRLSHTSPSPRDRQEHRMPPSA